jgi:hypothetical protein
MGISGRSGMFEVLYGVKVVGLKALIRYWE